MVAALTNESATSKSVYFAHCTSEMIFITHLLAEEPEKLAGPLLADTYVTLLKGRNAWYGQMLAKGELSLDMGDSISGKGMIQVLVMILYLATVQLGKQYFLLWNCHQNLLPYFPGSLCSGSILWTTESVKLERVASWRKQACGSCWALPHLEDTIQNSNNKVFPGFLLKLSSLDFWQIRCHNVCLVLILDVQGTCITRHSSSIKRWNLERSQGKDWDCTDSCFLQAFSSWPALDWVL